ncbi:toprim domain-containing protein [Parabacteroides sp. OttesenSCG-928-G07]|nr:toprim domain-containing protein [Parabacteroides sp. OttesenSCG-928-G07]
MDAITINIFPIREYLAGLNIHPAKDKGYYGMYHSPYREDNNASMKVDYNKNLWIDYGTNEGGTLIDLVMRIENCSNGEAMRSLEQRLSEVPSFSFHGNNTPERKEAKSESTIRINGVAPLSSPLLMDYLRERKINIDIARLHCKEINYSVNDKPYFAIGFKNDAGGYELRSKYFKGCTSKDITLHTSGQNSCQLFEGFMDYLSFLTMKNRQHSPVDAIVLNSLANLPKIENTLAGYKSVALFLDNDEAGKRAVQSLHSVCKEVIDQSAHYTEHKDLNDYLCNRSVPKQAVVKKPGRGRKM